MEWNRVTWYSWVAAVIVFGGVYALGFYVGTRYEAAHAPVTASPSAAAQPANAVVNDVTFRCDGGKTVRAVFHPHDVQLLLSDGRNLTVPQAISASGARYANADESFVFWNKGDTAFITEASSTTFANCALMPQPE
ncbi:MAG: MliC family protein [Patescibacteria group bacterium]|nr:MliC family protein [Patescibacteria group bacterium]MDE1966372.1 MliC family protein [Patescibacteria group bacterium]